MGAGGAIGKLGKAAKAGGKVVDEAVGVKQSQELSHLSPEAIKSLQASTSPGMEGGSRTYAQGSIKPEDFLDDMMAEQWRADPQMMSDEEFDMSIWPEVYQDWTEFDMAYGSGSLPEYLTLSGRVGDDGVLALDELSMEQQQLIGMHLRSGEGSDMAIRLDMGQAIYDVTELPAYYRLAGQTENRPMFTLRGLDNNPRWVSPEVREGVSFNYTDSPEAFTEAGGVERVFSGKHMATENVANWLTKQELNARLESGDLTERFDTWGFYDSQYANVKGTVTEADEVVDAGAAKMVVQVWGAESKKVWESVSNDVKTKLRGVKSIYTHKLTGVPKGDDTPLVFHHVGSDNFDANGNPISLTQGGELGMNGGKQTQTERFVKTDPKSEITDLERAKLADYEEMWEVLDNLPMLESAELRKAVSALYNKHLTSVTRGNRVDWKVSDELEADLYDYFNEEFGFNDEAVAEVVERFDIDGDPAEYIAKAIHAQANESFGQMQTAFIVTGKSPLYLRNVVTFYPLEVAEQLQRMPQFKKAKYEDDLEFIKTYGARSNETDDSFVQAKERLISMIESEGYDHVLYNNHFDDAEMAPTPSVIVWREDTIEYLMDTEVNSLSLAGAKSRMNSLIPRKGKVIDENGSQ